jgi:hypothetical protein
MSLAEPRGQRFAGISYVSGGVSEEERERLQQLSADYTLKLIFAGHYLSDVAVGIRDERGHQVLEAVAYGPWFFANLPAGRYHILAAAQGSRREQVVQISPHNQTRLTFSWTDHGSHMATNEEISPVD